MNAVSNAPLRSYIHIVSIALIVFGGAYALGSTSERLYAYFTAPPSPEALLSCLEDPATTSACLHETIPQLLSYMSTKTLQAYTVAESTPAPIRDRCHAIGHIIGQENFKKAGALEIALSACSNACRAACLHGTLGAGVLAELGEEYPDEDIAHADIATIEEIGSKYCASSAGLCHGIGHILYLVKGEDPQGIATCARVSSGYAREACYQGVYMERAGEMTGWTDALSPFQSATGTVTASTFFPCESAPMRYSHACFHFASAYAATDDSAQRKDTAREQCTALSGERRAFCFEGYGLQSFSYGTRLDDAPALHALCDELPLFEDRTSCTIGIIPLFPFLKDDPLPYCSGIEEKNRRAICYYNVFQFVGQLFEESLLARCGENPVCAENYRTFREIKSDLPDYRFGLFGDRWE